MPILKRAQSSYSQTKFRPPLENQVGVFTTLVGWEYSSEIDNEGNDVWKPLVDFTVTKEMIDAEYVIVKAVYEDKVAAFTVTDSEGVITPYINGDDLSVAVTSGTTGSLITFYSDVNERNEVAISQPLSFDLNGKTLTLSNSGNGIKTNHSDFTLYSSSVGGKVVFLGSCGLRVNANGTKNSPTFTLGRTGDSSGDGYLTLEGNAAFICQNFSSANSFGTVNIYGISAEISGTFLKYGYEVDLNVYNSEIVASRILDLYSSNPIAARPHTIDAEFKNSTLVAINANYNNHANLFKEGNERGRLWPLSSKDSRNSSRGL